MPYLLILPSVIALISLIVYPLYFSLTNSFYLWNLQTCPVPLMFVGTQNYRSVFTVTPFLDALRNTLMLSFGGTFIQFWFGLGIALLLNSHLKGMSAARVLLIMPTTIAPIVVGFLFRYMYYEGSGLISWLLTSTPFDWPISERSRPRRTRRSAMARYSSRSDSISARAASGSASCVASCSSCCQI